MAEETAMDRAGQLQAPIRRGPTSHQSLLVPSPWPVDLRMLVAFYLVLAAIAACLAFAGPFDVGTKITRAELGAAWPLTISEGTLHCESRGEIVVQHRGTGYSLTRHDGHGAYADVAAVQAVDLTGDRKDLGPLVEWGKRLCR